jgi:ubiquinone/menaquinone biosynthesis C-methylase UbiE
MKEPVEYSLGYSDAEAKRLAKQAALFEDLTEDVLRRAGLVHGMDVLDVGCGVGDVSSLAARMVGPRGSVLGVDRASSSVAMAQKRFCSQETTNLRFDRADLDAFETTRTFDAVIGRFVLAHLPNPAAILSRLRRFVKPGGIIVFQEMDQSTLACVPKADLHSRVIQWMVRGASAGGQDLEMGSKLFSVFVKAGLPQPTMIAAGRVEGGPQSYADEILAGVVQSLLPTIVRFGIASEAEIRIDGLVDRLRSESATTDCVVFLPRLVGAWSRL